MMLNAICSPSVNGYVMRNFLIRNSEEALCRQCGGYHTYLTIWCVPIAFNYEDVDSEELPTTLMFIPSKFIRTTEYLSRTFNGGDRPMLDADPFANPRYPVR